MKSGVALIIAILITVSLLALLRYEIRVYSPIIVKLDRLTGMSWVANNGVWVEIGHGARK